VIDDVILRRHPAADMFFLLQLFSYYIGLLVCITDINCWSTIEQIIQHITPLLRQLHWLKAKKPNANSKKGFNHHAAEYLFYVKR